jgi:hypothetical protein
MGFQALSLIFLFRTMQSLRDEVVRSQQKVIFKSLERRIYVDTQDDSFVQCVSPNFLETFSQICLTPP